MCISLFAFLRRWHHDHYQAKKTFFFLRPPEIQSKINKRLGFMEGQFKPAAFIIKDFFLWHWENWKMPIRRRRGEEEGLPLFLLRLFLLFMAPWVLLVLWFSGVPPIKDLSPCHWLVFPANDSIHGQRVSINALIITKDYVLLRPFLGISHSRTYDGNHSIRKKGGMGKGYMT